jgi:hypothetical protein
MRASLPVICVSVVLLSLYPQQLSGDLSVYRCYAMAFWYGGNTCNHPLAGMSLAPFHLFPAEYPPLGLVLFSLPLLAGAGYSLAFISIAILLLCALYGILRRWGKKQSASVLLLYSIGAWPVIDVRYDLFTSFATVIAILCMQHKQWTWAYLSLAIAVLLKLYPIILFPIFFLAEQEQPLRLPRIKVIHSFLCLGCVALVTAVFASLNWQGAVVGPIHYWLARPIQIESTGSALLWLGNLIGAHPQEVYGFGSINVAGRLQNEISQLLLLCTLGGYAWILSSYWKKKITAIQGCVAFLLVTIAFSKVLSPQYLIWVFPLLAYEHADNKPITCIWCVILALTWLIFPYLFVHAGVQLLQSKPFMLCVSIRDGLLVAFALTYIFNWKNIRGLGTDTVSTLPPGG